VVAAIRLEAFDIPEPRAVHVADRLANVGAFPLRLGVRLLSKRRMTITYISIKEEFARGSVSWAPDPLPFAHVCLNRPPAFGILVT